MRKIKTLKHVMALILALALLCTGTISFNAKAFANLTKSDSLLYITDKGNVPDSIDVYQGKDSNEQDKYEKLDIKSVKSSSIADIDATGYKFISVDDNLMDQAQIKAKLLESYENGGTVVIKKNGLKLKDVYQYFGVRYKNSDKFARDIDSQQSSEDKLKVVGISILKDSEGAINTDIISAEKHDTEEDINKAIANSIKLRPTTNNVLVKKDDNKILSLHSSVAYASNPGWTISASNSWTDNWTSVTIRYTAYLEKYPSNPDSQGKYYFLEYSPMTLTPVTGGYAIGEMGFYKDGAGATVVDLGPKPQGPSSTMSVSMGVPLSISFSYNVGTRVSLTVANGIGSTSTQWNFKPVDTLGSLQPTTSQLSFELVNEYKQSTSSFKIGNAYTVQMYKYAPTSGYTFYGTASKSGRYVSGT